MSITLRLQVRCIYTTTNDLANNINMMLLQAQEFKLFEQQKHCCIIVSWKNENFLLIRAFFDKMILTQALLSHFFGFLNFSSTFIPT